MTGYVITVTLGDGSLHTFTAKRLPTAWKSWAMHQLPYGTPCKGAKIERERVA